MSESISMLLDRISKLENIILKGMQENKESISMLLDRISKLEKQVEHIPVYDEFGYDQFGYDYDGFNKFNLNRHGYHKYNEKFYEYHKEFLQNPENAKYKKHFNEWVFRTAKWKVFDGR